VPRCSIRRAPSSSIPRTVLDGIHAGPHRRFDTFRSLGMGHDLLPGSMSNLHRPQHLLLAQFLNPIIANRIHHPAGSHQFDPVSTIFNIAPHRNAYRINRVRNIRTSRQFLIRRQHVGIAVSSVYRNKVSRRNHARSTNQSLLNAVTQCELPITQIVLSGITNCSETVIQPGLQVVYSPDGLLGR